MANNTKCLYCGKVIDSFIKRFGVREEDKFCKDECFRSFKIALGRNEFQTPLEPTCLPMVK